MQHGKHEEESDDGEGRGSRFSKRVRRSWLHEVMSAAQFASIFTFARSRGLSHVDADDVVQDTLIAAFLALEAGKFDPEQGTIHSWVRGIARHKVARLRRSRECIERHVRTCDDALLDGQGCDDEALRAGWHREWIRTNLGKALRRLRREMEPHAFGIYIHVALHNETPAHVATRYGVRRTTVYNVKSRGHRRLKEIVLASS